MFQLIKRSFNLPGKTPKLSYLLVLLLSQRNQLRGSGRDLLKRLLTLSIRGLFLET